MVQGSWVNGLEFAIPVWPFLISLNVEFDLFTVKEGNFNKVLLGSRYMLHWDEIEDSKFLKSIYDTSILVIALLLKKKWHRVSNSNFVPLLGLSIITLQMITRVYL